MKFLFVYSNFSGTVERRWVSFDERKVEAIIAMRGVGLIREENNFTEDENVKPIENIKAEWIQGLDKNGELGMRDKILKSFCPDVYGMYPVKLGIILAICSGNDIVSHDGLHQRSQSHILMIGDPGVAKSRLLLSAVSIAPKSIYTTGIGSSTAGLTAAAVKVRLLPIMVMLCIKPIIYYKFITKTKKSSDKF